MTVTYATSTSGGVSNARSIAMVEPAPVTLTPLAEYVTQACETELKTYCSQVIPGQSRLLACLYANGEKLSGQCETALYQAASVLDRAIGTVAYLADQCRADIDSKCASVPSGQGRIAQCLADHKDSLSPPCTQAISTARAQIE